MMKKVFSPKWSVLLVLAIALVSFTSVPAAAAENNNSSFTGNDGNEYTFTAESEGISLYVNHDTGLFFVMADNGDKFFSVSENVESDARILKKDKMAYGSQLIVEYAPHDDFTATGKTSKTNSKVACVNKDGVTVKNIKNGVRVEYEFDNIESYIPVEYTLVDGRLNASIIASEIKEGNNFSIISIDLLPTFGGAGVNENGYIFVPDGSGALINFNSNKKDNTYNAQVYGEELSVAKNTTIKRNNAQTVRMPVFGICQPGKNAVFANIISGDASSLIGAKVANDSFGLNICSSSMIYRTVTKDVYKTSNGMRVDMNRVTDAKFSLDRYTVQYSFFDSENSDYMAFVKEYQRYLVEEKGMGKSDNLSLVNLDVYGALEVAANFMGFKYTKLAPLTKYNNVVDILSSLGNNGIKDLSFRYIGWQNDGIFNNNIITNSKLISTLGGKKKWSYMQKYIDDNKITAVYDVDLIQYRRSFLNKSASTAFNKKSWQYEYLRSIYIPKTTVDSWLLIKPSLLENNASSYLKGMNKSVKHISLSTITNMLYSDFKEGKSLYRTDFTVMVDRILKKYKEAGYSIYGESANAYALPYLTAVYDAPSSSSGYKVFDRDILFYQLVLKGYISTTTAPRQLELRADDEFLKSVETGSAVLFNCVYENVDLIRGRREEEIYSSDYKLWQEIAAEQYKSYNTHYQKLLGKKVINNYELSDDVMITEFDDGTKIVVNYNYNDVSTPFGNVSARGFIVNNGGEA